MYMYTVILCRLVMAEHSVWQQMQWKSVECQEVEGVTARQIDMVQALPSFAQQWDVHQHLLSYLLTLQVSQICCVSLLGDELCCTVC